MYSSTSVGSRLFTTFFLLTFFALTCMAQEAEKITLEKIYRDELFTQESLEGLRSMNDGIHYTVQEGNQIKQYSFESGQKVRTLYDADKDPVVREIEGYQLSLDEQQILLESAHEKIYRHSYRARYYVFDMGTGKTAPLEDGAKQQLATFSPDGSKVAYVRGNNLYIKDLKDDQIRQLTHDGAWNKVINGAPDWVYEEEFAFTRAYAWSPDSRRIAFYRFDEERVRLFRMSMFGPLYPESYRFKYPKAGEENSLVSIHVHELESGKTSAMDLGEESNQYIPRIKWTKDPQILSIMRLNRLQNQLDILHAHAATGKSEVVYQEVNPRYISEASDETITYLEDGEHLILLSERDAFFHFYLLNFKSGKLSPITSGAYDVDAFLGFDEKEQLLYYTSHEESSMEKHVYEIGLKGKNKKKISSRPGSSTATFSTTYKYYILEHSSANSPAFISLHTRNGKQVRVLLDNAELKEEMAEHHFSPVEFLRIPTSGGQQLNAWMIKPPDFDQNKQYPLFIYVYGGPESQNVVDAWQRRSPWFQMLAQQGYIIACVDNRGTNGRGEEFRKSTYMTLGHLETIDQLEAASWLGSRDYIDEDRMGMYGWSYGGFMTSLCMCKGEGLIKMGIAGAPVTNWRYYDTVYTERFMRTPQENPEGYDYNSPIHFAAGLQGKFLLIHGMGDDNVHFQNSVDFSEALIQSGKQFDMQFYPNEPHSFQNPAGRLHLYHRMTDFILENL